MYPKLTYSLLVEKNACSNQLALVEKHFGKIKPIPLTSKVVTKFASIFNIDWAERSFLTKKDFKEYDRVGVSAFAKYLKATDSAWAEHNNEINAKVRAKGKYNKVIAKASAEYDKVTALEFARLYKKGMK